MLGTRESRTFASIIGGKIAIKCEEGTPGCVKRDYEIKATGEKGTKYEMQYDYLKGVIEKIEFVDGKFGQQIQILIDGTTLVMGTDSKYGSDFMKKLPGINFDEVVTIRPYSMEKDGKKLAGVTVYQQGDGEDAVKIADQFYNKDTKEYNNGFPKPKKETEKMSKTDWKSYFIGVQEFLVEYIINNVQEKVNSRTGFESITSNDEEEQELNIDDMPFNDEDKI
ncbi:MAG: hypothetical protein PHF05_06375 [Candidatus Izemoplasmatales bacterium]|nr:hypothetical protein [Candidatus Izemoplasmatales bacterium]